MGLWKRGHSSRCDCTWRNKKHLASSCSRLAVSRLDVAPVDGSRDSRRLAVGAFLASPPNVKERAESLIKPQENVDSNRFREVTFWTGLEMIKAHPWFGLGPEEISRYFGAYVPKYIHKPLPPGYYGHLHNIYVQFAAERGIPGLMCVLWFIGLAVYDGARAIFSGVKGSRSQELFILHGMIADDRSAGGRDPRIQSRR